MNQHLKKRLGKLRLENTITTFHLVFAIAPVLGAITATLLEDEELHHYIEIALLVLVTLINFFLLWLHSRVDEEGEERSPLYTFWSDKLPPNSSGDRQSADARIAIIEASSIEDSGTGNFREALKKRFKTEFSVDRLREILSEETRLKSTILKAAAFDKLYSDLRNRNLFFKHLGLGPHNKDHSEKLYKELKKKLDDGLQDATAVVLVRTSASDKRDWVYRALSDWGYEHSEIPILIAKDPNKTFSDDAVAKRFLWIPDEPNELPWSMLRRALARAKAWRTQAAYNRAMVWNIVYILLLCMYISVIWTKDWKREVQARTDARIVYLEGEQQRLAGERENQKQTANVVKETTDQALETERSLRLHNSEPKDKSFAVSYWYRIDGVPHILVSTETMRNTQRLPNDFTSVIGCTFVKPNHLIQAELLEGPPRQSRTIIYDTHLQKVSDFQCQMADLTMPIKKIYCGSYDNGSAGHIRTIGVCAFTHDARNQIFSKAALEDLWKRVLEFNKIAEKIEGKKEMSLVEREPKASSIHAH